MEIVKNFLLVAVLNIALFGNSIIIKNSHCSVDKTVNKIRNIVTKKGLHIFAVINHSGNAKMVNMKLNKSKMIIFGNARLGTALMQQDMTVGLDLPLRILVYRDNDGQVKMAYRNASWLANKHMLNAAKKVARINKAMDKITDKAGQCKRD
jgi:uncharacterized protein (DUF302 family)